MKQSVLTSMNAWLLP